MATGASPLLATALLASGVGSLVLTNAAPLSWAVASLSVWSTFVLASSKDGVRQSWLHVLWAYSAAAAFVFYLSTDPGFQVSKICVFAMSEPEDASLDAYGTPHTAISFPCVPIPPIPCAYALAYCQRSLGSHLHAKLRHLTMRRSRGRTSTTSVQTHGTAPATSGGHGGGT